MPGKYDKLTQQDKADIATQYQRVEKGGEFQPSEYAVLRQMLWKLGFVAGTVAAILAIADKIAGMGLW